MRRQIVYTRPASTLLVFLYFGLDGRADSNPHCHTIRHSFITLFVVVVVLHCPTTDDSSHNWANIYRMQHFFAAACECVRATSSHCCWVFRFDEIEMILVLTSGCVTCVCVWMAVWWIDFHLDNTEIHKFSIRTRGVVTEENCARNYAQAQYKCMPANEMVPIKYIQMYLCQEYIARAIVLHSGPVWYGGGTGWRPW